VHKHNRQTDRRRDRQTERQDYYGNTALYTKVHCTVKTSIISPRKRLYFTVGRFKWINLSVYNCLQCCDAVGWTAGRVSRNWVVRYWCGYLSGVRCKWFACGPADATANPSSLVPVKSRIVYLSGASLHRLSWKKGCSMDVVVVVVVVCLVFT